MTHELVTEANRLSRTLNENMRHSSVAAEVPLRIHSIETDAGGAPEFHPAFLRYIDQGVCTCGRPPVCAPNCHFMKERALGHLRDCEPGCRPQTQFRGTGHRNSAGRMKRAMNQVRKLNPKAYDFVYLIVALHYTFEQAVAKINDDEVRRGRAPKTDAEYAVLWVSGASMLATGF